VDHHARDPLPKLPAALGGRSAGAQTQTQPCQVLRPRKLPGIEGQARLTIGQVLPVDQTSRSTVEAAHGPKSICFILKCKPEDAARVCNGYDTRTFVRVKSPFGAMLSVTPPTSCATPDAFRFALIIVPTHFADAERQSGDSNVAKICNSKS
jgi:hypothetical protein